ncbi:MAG TPA: molybdate ABC transporter substrate-binding protein [Bryobacteraceae bacterium]|jgi:molybdate transport system substrate-binding protein|nr:molybdate ABC transporter substrate-binding protein [Bryobacteraceae bacterium]
MPALRSAVAAGLLAILSSACGHRAPARKLTVAAAADLQFALAEGAQQFQQQTHTALTVSYGSSGNFYAQIRNGAPFDVFLSADVEYPRHLVRDGIAAADSVFPYADGKIAVWVPSASKLDPATAVQDPALRRLAIANPQHAPYGRAADAALHKLGLYDGVAKKIVMGENISQTLEFAQSGAADAGIVALSLILAPNMRGQGRYWELPVNSYPKIEQGGVILKDSPAARQFRDWLLGPSGRALLQQFGFSLPGE